MIGVNSAIYSPNGGSVGIGFAIPASLASGVIEQLMSTGTVERGYLGVHIQTLSGEIAENLGLDNANGALVTRVMEGSPASAAGIEAGDVITTFNGKELGSMRDLPKLVARAERGKEVPVVLWRDGSDLTVEVTVGVSDEGPQLAAASPQPESPADRQLGLVLEPITPETARELGMDEDATGVVVVEVDPGSNAAARESAGAISSAKSTRPGLTTQTIFVGRWTRPATATRS